MSDNAKPASGCTGPSDCSLTIKELEDIATMRPDWIVDFLERRSWFDAAAVEKALYYAIKKAQIDLAANAPGQPRLAKTTKENDHV